MESNRVFCKCDQCKTMLMQVGGGTIFTYCHNPKCDLYIGCSEDEHNKHLERTYADIDAKNKAKELLKHQTSKPF